MSGSPLRAKYTAIRGVTTTPNEIMKCFAQAMEERHEELMTDFACYSSTRYESSGIGNFQSSNLLNGRNRLECTTYHINSDMTNSTKALVIDANHTPTVGATAYLDLTNYFSYGDLASISMWVKHIGMGGQWSIYINDSPTVSGARLVQNISANDHYINAFRRVQYSIDFNPNTRYLVFVETNGANDGGIAIDDMSFTKVEIEGQDTLIPYLNNNQFSTTEDWTAETGWSIGSGLATCSGAQTSETNIYQTVPRGLIEGNTYRVFINIQSYTAGTLYFEIGGNRYGGWTSTGVKEIEVVAGSTDIFSLVGDSNFNGSVTYALIYGSSNSVSNGTFESSGDDWSLGSWSVGSGFVNPSGSSGELTQDVIDFEVGAFYEVTWTISNYVSGNVRLNNSYGVFAGNNTNYNSNGTHVQYVECVAPREFNIYSASFSGELSNIRVRKVNTDLSGTIQGIPLYGGIYRNPIAPGSTFSMFGGWSYYNYGKLPYNSNFDFGTGGNYSFGVLFRLNCDAGNKTDRTMLSRGYHNGTNWVGSQIQMGISGTLGTTEGSIFLRFSDDAFSNEDRFETNTRFDNGLVYFAYVTVNGTEVKLHINGALFATYTLTNAVGNMDNASAELYIGSDVDFELEPSKPFFDGEIGLVRFNSSTLALVDVKNEYNNERHMASQYSTFAIEDNSYDLYFYASRFTPRHKIEGPRPQVSLNNTDEVIINYELEEFDITTANIEEIEMPDWREFMHSVRGRVPFTLLPNDVHVPYSPMTVKMVTDSYREDRVVNQGRGEYQISFRVKK